ncbi:hypothetical protein AB3S75_040333 [Citrus x aurantiifolia]
MNNFKKQKMTRCGRSYYDLAAQVIGVAPTNCVVEISKSAGELRVYKEFCKSLSSPLTEKSDTSPRMQVPEEVSISSRSTQKLECSEDKNKNHNEETQGYSYS